MFYLDLFEEKIKSLSFYQKIQLYLIPLLLSIFYLYNFVNFSSNEIKKSKQILESNNVNTYTFLSDLQEFANKQNLEILETKQNSKILDLEIKGELSSIIEALYFCETYNSVNKIDNLEIDIQNKEVLLHLKLEFEKYKYNFTKVDFVLLEEIGNKNKEPQISKKMQTIKKDIQWKLTAIVNNSALLNNSWIKEGDTINQYQVSKIDMHFVRLISDTGKKITLHINKGKM